MSTHPRTAPAHSTMRAPPSEFTEPRYSSAYEHTVPSTITRRRPPQGSYGSRIPPPPTHVPDSNPITLPATSIVDPYIYMAVPPAPPPVHPTRFSSHSNGSRHPVEHWGEPLTRDTRFPDDEDDEPLEDPAAEYDSDDDEDTAQVPIARGQYAVRSDEAEAMLEDIFGPQESSLQETVTHSRAPRAAKNPVHSTSPQSEQQTNMHALTKQLHLLTERGVDLQSNSELYGEVKLAANKVGLGLFTLTDATDLMGKGYLAEVSEKKCKNLTLSTRRMADQMRAKDEIISSQSIELSSEKASSQARERAWKEGLKSWIEQDMSERSKLYNPTHMEKVHNGTIKYKMAGNSMISVA